MFSNDDPRKTLGWFSRRHATSAELEAYRADKQNKIEEWRNLARNNEIARANRTPAQQLAVLDQRLGKNLGAKKERARLLAKIKKA